MQLYIDLLAYAAGTITAVCFLPQIYQTLRTRRANDVSLSMLLLTIASLILYEIYALVLSLWPVVIMNAVALVLVGVEVILKLYFDRGGSDESAA